MQCRSLPRKSMHQRLQYAHFGGRELTAQSGVRRLAVQYLQKTMRCLLGLLRGRSRALHWTLNLVMHMGTFDVM